MKAVRGTETTEADVGSARLSADEERLEALELRGNSRMTGAKTGAGGLEALSGRDIDLKYLPDGQTLQHVLVAGDAAIQLAGESGHAGRRITSNLVDIALGPDGSSPTALTARENVELTIPAEPDALARTIRAQTLDGTGEAGKGLTSARFAETCSSASAGRTSTARHGRRASRWPSRPVRARSTTRHSPERSVSRTAR